jgi:hypothetical protein
MVLPSAHLAELQSRQPNKSAILSEAVIESPDGTYTFNDALLFANGRTVKADKITREPSGSFTADQQTIDLNL